MINEKTISRLMMVRALNSISKAADRLYISRSSLVQQIKQIEASLGFTLFERTPLGTQTTAAGEKYLSEIQQLLRGYDRLVRACSEMQESAPERIVIGGLSNFKSPLLQDICQRFLTRNPNVSFDFRDYTRDEYLRKFRNGEFDICTEYMMDYFMDDSNVVFQKIAETHYVCGFVKGHRLYGAKKVSLADLKGEKIVMYNKGISRTADRLRTCISREAPEVTLIGIDTYDSNLYTKCSLENAGMMSFALYEDSFPQFHYAELEPNIKIELGVGFHRDARPAVLKFVESISGMKRQY